MNRPIALLNQLTPTEFLKEYWQKKPLLIKQAIPDFKSFLTPNELAGLACEEDIQARIIQYKKKQWLVKEGPFNGDDFTSLAKKDWTLLVQKINHHLPEAHSLLKQFNFIPHVRLDDLMISYAPKGGGVGPHMDSYDVFLLQGKGKRQWQTSDQTDLSLVEDTPIKILNNFNAEHTYILEAGDMLYLPPHIAHNGIALDDNCMTYSIGFRAPKMQELRQAFLDYLQDHLQADDLYADPDLTLQDNPAEISLSMLNKVDEILRKLSWNKDITADFFGRYMTEPNNEVFFEPTIKISPIAFSKLLAEHTLQLNLKSQMLFFENSFYINGEQLQVTESLFTIMQYFANHRQLDTTTLSDKLRHNLAKCLLTYYIAGYMYIE